MVLPGEAGMKNKKRIIIAAICIAAAVIVLAAAGLMVKNEIIKFNTPSRSEYPVRGIDVSR